MTHFNSLKVLLLLLLINALLLNAATANAENEPGNTQKAVAAVKIATLSYIPAKWDKEANLKTIEKLAREAASNGAQILITPEGGLEGYLIDELLNSPEREKWEPRFREIAEPVDGPSILKVRNLARELGTDLVLGFLERDGKILYNSCAWINPKGDIIHVHRKTQLAENYFDPEYYHPGYEIKAFDTRFGRIGMLICFERQIPEVSTALALDGARILINPSYGSRGEWNDIMLRTRARDNEAYFIFAHPKQSLMISPDGKVIVNRDNDLGAGIVYADLGLDFKPVSKLAKRRDEAFRDKVRAGQPGSNHRLSAPGKLNIAAVQMHSSHNLKENVDHICRLLTQCAQRGVRVAVFPECATTGYFKEDIPSYSEQDYKAAEQIIAETCNKLQIYAVIGTPYFENGKVFNMGLVIDPSGNTIYRQPKIHQVGGDKPWSVPGNRLGVFSIDGLTSSLVICHDSRYPELVRLPVIKGSRLLFYLSCESDITAEQKIEPYRAQVVARAVENQIFVVQSNTPQNTQPREGSHGQSKIVDPKGTILKEASIFSEEIVSCIINLNEATRSTALRSMEAPFLREWWQNGLDKVEVPE